MGYRWRKVPKGIGPSEAFGALIRSVRTGRALPKGYDVEWQWRNAPHLPLHSGAFVDVVTDSARGGFREIMIERLEDDKRIAEAAILAAGNALGAQERVHPKTKAQAASSADRRATAGRTRKTRKRR
jgi:hypothetical protein